jgi:predicted GNAT family acetyltransferase
MSLSDEKLDEALEETFPASDAPANTVATGVHLKPAEVAVRDNREANRFEAVVDGHLAFLAYERRPGTIIFLKTEVPESLRGRGIGRQLAKAGIASAQAEALGLEVRCPFMRGYLRRLSGGRA